jgi:hypothetical protein
MFTLAAKEKGLVCRNIFLLLAEKLDGIIYQSLNAIVRSCNAGFSSSGMD